LIILRHDVDNSFSLKSLFSKGMNYLSLKLSKIFPRWRRLGYLKDALELFELEKEFGIKATWFFRTSTRPFLTFRKQLLANGHEIGFHADRIENEALFLKDFKTVAQDTKIFGFTKHGSRGLPTPLGVGVGEVYNLDLYVKRAKKIGLSYFAGNDVNPTDTLKIIEGIAVFPSAFWVAPGYMDDKKFTVDWLIKYQKNHDVVVLIHPLEATEVFPDRKEKVEKILSCCEEVVTFKKYLEINGFLLAFI
jgi:hypothetical protein